MNTDIDIGLHVRYIYSKFDRYLDIYRETEGEGVEGGEGRRKKEIEREVERQR